MYRLFIILFFYSSYYYSQNKVQLLHNAKLEKLKGNNKKSLEIYQKLLEEDSTNIHLKFEVANLFFELKNYNLSKELYLQIRTNKNATKFEPTLSFNLGMIYITEEKYTTSINEFKNAMKFNTQSLDKQFKNKCIHQIESATWAISNTTKNIQVKPGYFNDSFTPETSEIFHSENDSNYIISKSILDDDIYQSKLFLIDKSKINNDGNRKVLKNFDYKNLNSVNGSYSLDKKRFYLSLCKNNRCKIVVSKYENNNWSEIDTLRGEINYDTSNYTMPSVGVINGREVLFYCSNKNNKNGNLDIYYGLINNIHIDSSKFVPQINTEGNEITPFYSIEDTTLYFSSDYHYGFGGFDAFKIKYNGINAEKIENLGKPINSSYNDLYYYKKDSIQYITTNRIKESNCCNSILSFITQPEKKIFNEPKVTDSLKEDKLKSFFLSFEQLKSKDTNRIYPVNYKSSLSSETNLESTKLKIEKLLPITLYFHNDEPNPKYNGKNTSQTYIDTYSEYIKLNNEYKTNSSNNSEDIEHFFNDKVILGKQKLDSLLILLHDCVNDSVEFNIEIKGYASPLAKNQYNKNLGIRRTKTIINLLKDVNLFQYVNSKKINIELVSFGEEKANKKINDNPLQRDKSIYSIDAALERKVEINSIQIIKKR